MTKMRPSKLRPHSLAGQAVALQVAVVAIIVVVGSGLAFADARLDKNDAARAEVTAIAVSIADSPSTAAALRSTDPAAVLQPVTEQIRATTGAAFITIMGPDGTRFTHTNPAMIRQKYIGSTEQALQGEVFTEVYTGTLGPSVRTIAPVRGADGRVVGLVAVGITQERITHAWLGQLPVIISVALAALGVGLAGLWLIRRLLLRHTGGLAPGELRLMYEHHDAVLHAIREGLVVTEARRPVLVNDEARRLLAVGQAADPDDALDGDLDLPEVLTEDDRPLVDVATVHHGRVLMINRAAVPGRRDGAVVTLRDRTELRTATGELDSMRHFAESLRSRAHETANLLQIMVTLIEIGKPEEAARIATSELELSQHLIDRMTEAVTEPALVALLLGKTAEASERGIALSLTEESRVAPDAKEIPVAELVTVLGNLIDNALDAADPDDPWVEVTVVADAEHLEIAVADSGGGLDEALLAQACRRGYSTKPGGDEAGRGLGLALVAQVLGKHGGSLHAANTYGSVITATIPARTEAVP